MKFFENHWTFRILWAFFILATCNWIALLLWYWPGTLPDGPTSGVWTSLAFDFSEGVFYRPLMSEEGYGGTRYMPLFFVIHGLLIKVLGNPIQTGVGLSLVCITLFILGIAFLLKELKAPWKIALPLSVSVLTTLSLQMTSLNIRGDFLASALNIWALWFAFRGNTNRQWGLLYLSAILFALAFLTKFTSLFGCFAVTLYLILKGQNNQALRLAGTTGAIIFLGLGMIHWASEGRALHSFLECSTGGMQSDDVLSVFTRFSKEMIHDPFLGILLALMIVAWAKAKPDWKTLPSLVFLSTLGVTLIIYTSPGTATNHLIDFQGALILALGFLCSQNSWALKVTTAGLACVGIYIVASWHPEVPSVRNFFKQHGKPETQIVDDFYRRYGEKVRPVLSDYTYFALHQGNRAYVGDRFNLNLLMKKHPEIKQDFEKKIESRFFGSIVKSNWPGIFKKNIDSRDDPHFKERVMKYHAYQRDPYYPLMLEHYEITSVQRPFVFFSPRQ